VTDSDRERLRRTLRVLGLLCAVTVLAGINRKLNIPLLRAPLTDALRLCDYLVMICFAPLVLVLLWNLIKINGGTSYAPVVILFLGGVYLIGMGFGMHEPMNALQATPGYCPPEPFRQSIIFFDDKLGHWVFFIGFALVSITVALAELRNPYLEPVSLPAAAGAGMIGFVSAIVIYFNMVREQTGVDIAVILATLAAIAAVHLCHSRTSLRRLPVVLTCYIAYGLGSAATFLHWLLRRP